MIITKHSFAAVDRLISRSVEKEGINPGHRGFKYIERAIKMVLVEHDKINAVTKEIYVDIASDAMTTPEAVERSIRFAIERASSSGCGSKKTSNKDFILKTSKKILDEIESIVNQKY